MDVIVDLENARLRAELAATRRQLAATQAAAAALLTRRTYLPRGTRETPVLVPAPGGAA